MSKKKEVSMLQMILTVLYVCSYMIANIITAKQVQFPIRNYNDRGSLYLSYNLHFV